MVTDWSMKELSQPCSSVKGIIIQQLVPRLEFNWLRSIPRVLILRSYSIGSFQSLTVSLYNSGVDVSVTFLAGCTVTPVGGEKWLIESHWMILSADLFKSAFIQEQSMRLLHCCYSTGCNLLYLKEWMKTSEQMWTLSVPSSGEFWEFWRYPQCMWISS